ncbi:SLC16A12 [Bugula neritina]|uniref:SLC16A12 n=1 Tax=Bugula neritina TaxID=10212 RepID=A0A7J7K8Z1_BUGNE|nr:SLC16A12 [Bugula neritina]
MICIAKKPRDNLLMQLHNYYSIDASFVGFLTYGLMATMHRIVGIILVETKSINENIDDQTGLWIVSLTIFLSFAIGLGIGNALISAIWCSTVYFEKRKATAVGLITSGSGVVTLFLPSVCRFLFDNLTYQESLITIAGITLHLLVPIMFIRPESYW